MKRLGPWLTLAAVAVLGIVLIAVNMSRETEPATANTNSPPASPVSATSAAPATTVATPQFPPKADYVGTIPPASGAPITLAITVQGDRAIAYACDGRTVESWLQGPVSNGTLQLTGRNDAKLDGRLDGTDVRGTLSLGGKQWEYRTAPAQPPAGLYVYRDGQLRESWIVDSTGTVTGVQRGPDGATSPAPALAPDGTATVNGKKITANKVSGGDSVG